MCQNTDAKPLRVSALSCACPMKSRLTCTVMVRYSLFYSERLVCWYEAVWGPLMAETASFVKVIVAPGGTVSIN